MAANEDDIDSETLQAQIDMSMSFAHNLVTSWVQSAQVGQLRSGISDAERILHEELRRPPRLGVGAPIPAATSANRDASKLRHRLAKMDAKTASLLQTSSQPGPGSDEEEEKGRTKRRATNIDPFVMHGNKKRKKSNGSGKMETEHAISRKSPDHGRRYLQPNGVSTQVPGESLPVLPMDKSPETPVKASPSAVIGSSAPCSDLYHLPNTVRNHTEVNDAIPTPRIPVQSTGNEVPVTQKENPLQARWLEDCHLLLPVSRGYRVASKQLSIPLLNLDGPLQTSERIGNSDDPNKPEKQRKRRKKKKRVTGTAPT